MLLTRSSSRAQPFPPWIFVTSGPMPRKTTLLGTRNEPEYVPPRTRICPPAPGRELIACEIDPNGFAAVPVPLEPCFTYTNAAPLPFVKITLVTCAVFVLAVVYGS